MHRRSVWPRFINSRISSTLYRAHLCPFMPNSPATICRPMFTCARKIPQVTDNYVCQLHETYPTRHQHCYRYELNNSWPDTIWSMMAEGKYYSIRDLTSLSGASGSMVAEVVSFLARYGFIERAGWDESIYTKSKIVISPGKSVDLLKELVKNAI
jgi:hypothetical protein